MKILLLKTSSLGDLIHTFPALTDAARQIPGIRFDWVVEEAFQQVPSWHPAVDRVIPVALRRWRKDWSRSWRTGEPGAFVRELRNRDYDLVLDAQGLLKSAIPACLARGKRAGYGRKSIREPLAALFYNRRYPVSRELHAIERVRRLFGLALGYEVDAESVDYGLRIPEATAPVTEERAQKYLVFLHSTTWPTKHWPEPYWAELARMATDNGYRVIWPWYMPEERLRAERLIASGGGELAPRLDLQGMAELLAGASGVVGVDSGLAHLAAALGCWSVSLYGPTSSRLTGVIGKHQTNLVSEYTCAPCLSRECVATKNPLPMVGSGARVEPRIMPPCFVEINPVSVWQKLVAGLAH